MALPWFQFALLLATVSLVAHSSLSVGTGEEVGRQLSFPFMVSTWALPRALWGKNFFNEGLK